MSYQWLKINAKKVQTELDSVVCNAIILQLMGYNPKVHLAILLSQLEQDFSAATDSCNFCLLSSRCSLLLEELYSKDAIWMCYLFSF